METSNSGRLVRDAIQFLAGDWEVSKPWFPCLAPNWWNQPLPTSGYGCPADPETYWELTFSQHVMICDTLTLPCRCFSMGFSWHGQGQICWVFNQNDTWLQKPRPTKSIGSLQVRVQNRCENVKRATIVAKRYGWYSDTVLQFPTPKFLVKPSYVSNNIFGFLMHCPPFFWCFKGNCETYFCPFPQLWFIWIEMTLLQIYLLQIDY